jgi:hypothetical protein
MPSPIETILTSVGIPAEDVTSIVSLSAEDAEKFDANPYLEKVKGNYQTQFKNDPAFFSDITIENLSPEVKKKIESSQFGRAAKITMDRLVKGLGMTEADYADLSDEQKEKLETFIPAIAEKYAKTKAGDKQLQQDLIEARKKLEGYDGYEEKVKTQYEKQSEGKIATAIFRANLIGELSRIPGLKISASDIAKTADEILSSKYAFERVGDFGVELRQKANPQMKVLKNGSSHELTLSEALLEIATDRNWVDKEAGTKSGSGTAKVIPGKDGLKASFVPPHLQSKISSKIAAEKQ